MYAYLMCALWPQPEQLARISSLKSDFFPITVPEQIVQAKVKLSPRDLLWEIAASLKRWHSPSVTVAVVELCIQSSFLLLA